MEAEATVVTRAKKNPTLVRFGELVRCRREGMGLSQEGLGFEVGLHRTYIGMIERAERNISFLHALTLMQYLHIEHGELHVKNANQR